MASNIRVNSNPTGNIHINANDERPRYAGYTITAERSQTEHGTIITAEDWRGITESMVYDGVGIETLVYNDDFTVTITLMDGRTFTTEDTVARGVDQAESAAEHALESQRAASASEGAAAGSATQASAAAGSALTYANRAETAATAASTYANRAKASAESIDGILEVVTDLEASTVQKANEASNSAAQASGAASTAATKAAEAGQSASTASTEASRAESYRTDALNAKTAAETAADNAEASETSANAWAVEARTYASNASASATASATSASEAEASAQSAAQSAATVYSLLPADTASGDIASFPDGANAVPMDYLKVMLEPIQPCTPWMGSEEYNNPYLMQAMPTISEAYNTEMLKKIVGGTVAWNQYVKPRTTVNFGIRATQDADGVITLSGTALNTYSNFCEDVPKVADHKYLVTWTVLANPNNLPIKPNANTGMRARFFYENWGILIGSNDTGTVANFGAYQMTSGADYTGVKLKINFHDITQMFGTAIADYIYNLNSDGIAFFKSLFPNDYYPYNSGELLSVQTSAHVTKDGNGQQIASYPLDSSLTLRGIPKLDAQNNLYYDGDEYLPSGSVTRKYGIVDLGTLTWDKTGTGLFWSDGIASVAKGTADKFNSTDTLRSAMFIEIGSDPISGPSGANPSPDKVMAINVNARLFFNYLATTDATAFKTAMSGVYLVYELATPTTESAEPYTSQQSVDPSGTEEFVSASVVPVGHVSSYARVCPISGHTEVVTHRTGKNLIENDEFMIPVNSDPNIVWSGSMTGEFTLSIEKSRVQSVTNPSQMVGFAVVDGRKKPLIYADGYVTFNGELTSIAIYGSLAYARVVGTIGLQLELGTTASDYELYDGDTYTTSLGRTVYGGTLDVVSGELTVTWGYIASYNGETLPSTWISDRDVHASGTTPTTGAQVVYELATPQTIQLTPQEVRTLLGTNNVWSDGVYHPLVKRYLKDNSWVGRYINGVMYYVNNGYGYLHTDTFKDASVDCSHFAVKKFVPKPTDTSTPLADNALYLTDDGSLYVRYDAIEDEDPTVSLQNWIDFVTDNNVFMTVPSYSDTASDSLEVELEYRADVALWVERKLHE